MRKISERWSKTRRKPVQNDSNRYLERHRHSGIKSKYHFMSALAAVPRTGVCLGCGASLLDTTLAL